MNGYESLISNFASFSGTGGYMVLTAACVLYLFLKEKNRFCRAVFVWLPLGVAVIFFCPLWIVYLKVREDGEILYRLLWLLPFGAVIAYTFTKLVTGLKTKLKYAAVAAGFLILGLFGRYIYASPFFSPAQNAYHVPETVVRICDEIEVPGREIKACFPEEFTSYVRQYTATVHLTYGRESYMPGVIDTLGSDAMYLLRREKVDTKALTGILRDRDTPYLILRKERIFTEKPEKYDFRFVTEIDGYSIYLDDKAYIGLNADEIR